MDTQAVRRTTIGYVAVCQTLNEVVVIITCIFMSVYCLFILFKTNDDRTLGAL